MSDDPAERRLAEMGIVLPTPPAAAASYDPAVRTGNLLFVSGQLPIGPGGLRFAGKIGRDYDLAAGQEAARLCAINILAQARAALGSLDAIRRVVKLTGFVNGTADFTDAHLVINGASELIATVLDERGRHSRAAVTVASLPMGAAVEVDAIIEVG